MHPVIFKIFSFPIHSYGLMLALSFLLGIWLSSWRAKKAGLDPNIISDVGFWIIISAIIGARLYYVFLHIEEFQSDWVSIFNPFHNGYMGIGGLVMYGGFIGAIVAGFVFFKVKKLPFLPYVDAIAPSVGIGIFLTRIGCFLNGCCYGAPTHSHYGVSFPADSPAGAYQLSNAADLSHTMGHSTSQLPLLPSQLFESVGGLLITGIILLAGLRKTFVGFQFYLVGVLYAILRFGIDFTRYYPNTERIGPLSHNQVVCIILFIIFTGLMLKNLIPGLNENQSEGSAKNIPATTEAQKNPAT